MKHRHLPLVMVLSAAGTVLAQDGGLSVSVGVRAWYAEWTTFSYLENPPGTNIALTQVSADDKLVAVPIVSLRYGDFVGSVSGYPSTQFSLSDGRNGKRQEFDVNAGYALMQGLTLTLGYKKVVQSNGADRYRPSGPVFGVNANAALGSAVSLYGVLGIGRLKTPAGDKISFRANYRLTEVGLAYTLNTGRMPRLWTFTGGYRMQVMSSKEAFGTQDGRDTSQGFTFGAIATF